MYFKVVFIYYFNQLFVYLADYKCFVGLLPTNEAFSDNCVDY